MGKYQKKPAFGKKMRKSKTLWAGIATIATGIGMYITGEQDLGELVVACVGVIFAWLRFYTNEPLIK